jgi:hypothetical protein
VHAHPFAGGVELGGSVGVGDGVGVSVGDAVTVTVAVAVTVFAGGFGTVHTTLIRDPPVGFPASVVCFTVG